VKEGTLTDTQRKRKENEKRTRSVGEKYLAISLHSMKNPISAFEI